MGLEGREVIERKERRKREKWNEIGIRIKGKIKGEWKGREEEMNGDKGDIWYLI